MYLLAQTVGQPGTGNGKLGFTLTAPPSKPVPVPESSSVLGILLVGAVIATAVGTKALKRQPH